MKISPVRFFFFFDLTLKLSVVYLRNKQINSVTHMEFYKYVQYCFCCYIIKSAGEVANKVLLCVVWNPLLIEINLSQIRALDIKREKVRAVCPYLLFSFPLSLKLRVVHKRKKLKIFIFSKMVPTILFKFCGFIVHSKHNNMTLSAFPGKIPETGKKYF